MAAAVSLPSPNTTSRPPLPEGWSEPELVEDTIVADGLAIRRAGAASVAPGGEEITGSAAERDADDVSARAWFELLERASVVEAMSAGADRRFDLLTPTGVTVGTRTREELFPESDDPSTWRYARSNGVALHLDWATACERALCELAERDRILASWLGHVRPERLAWNALEGATSIYEWSAWSFPEERPRSFSKGIDVVAVLGFPTAPDAPLAVGFAARRDRRSALDAATREAVQLLGFLWGEPVASMPTRVDPTAMGHLDRHQADHDALRRWLAGEHVHHASSDPRRPSGAEDVTFADLTPAWLSRSCRVAKASCARARPLVFGESPFSAHLPRPCRIHPVG